MLGDVIGVLVILDAKDYDPFLGLSQCCSIHYNLFA
jgi:hypothetical protein